MVARCNESDATTHTYTNNSNTGKITGNYAAGIIAYTYVQATVSGCTNSGNITSKTDYAGGMVAYVVNAPTFTFDTCTNDGIIDARICRRYRWPYTNCR